MPDAALVEAIRRVLADSPFHGPRAPARSGRGCAMRGLRTSKGRVRRLMREHALSAASRVGRPRGPRAHDGTIVPEAVDAMWDEPSSAIGPRTMANDMTAAFTLEHGQVAVLVAVDHASAQCTGIHAARRGTRHEALEPIRQGPARAGKGRQGPARAGKGSSSASVPSARTRPGASASATTTARNPCPTTSGARSPGPRGRVVARPRPRARGQRLRRALRPHAEGEPALGADLRHPRGTPPGAARVPRPLQELWPNLGDDGLGGRRIVAGVQAC